MNTLSFFSLALVLGFTQNAHADPRWIQFKLQHHSSAALEKVAADLWFDQKTDHFTPSDKRTFKQRYFVDSTYATGANAPVIYYFCGEGTCEGASGEKDQKDLVSVMAKKYGAHRVALEHRYYGYSQPFKTLASANLKYLSMDQALEDLASFQVYAQTKLGLSGKWISVGGSYSGALSAFYRLKHPELVVGALASSAPVLAKDNFEDYDHHVAQVAGPDCLAAIQATVVDVEAKLKDPTSALALKKLFNADAVKDNVDFLYVLADMASTAVQYGYQKPFCDALATGMKDGKVTEAYADVGNKLFGLFGTTSLEDSFQGATSINPKDYLGFAGSRSWMYQSCTEFGYYQVAYHVPAESMRSSQITLQYHNDVCKRLFGLTTPVNVDKTNSTFYQQLFNANVKNIFFTNGSNDPWSLLSITAQSPNAMSNPGLTLFTIEDAAHCDDLGSRVSDALGQARNEFDQLMTQWLK